MRGDRPVIASLYAMRASSHRMDGPVPAARVPQNSPDTMTRMPLSERQP